MAAGKDRSRSRARCRVGSRTEFRRTRCSRLLQRREEAPGQAPRLAVRTVHFDFLEQQRRRDHVCSARRLPRNRRRPAPCRRFRRPALCSYAEDGGIVADAQQSAQRCVRSSRKAARRAPALRARRPRSLDRSAAASGRRWTRPPPARPASRRAHPGWSWRSPDYPSSGSAGTTSVRFACRRREISCAGRPATGRRWP